jgi:alanyl-tRNA synthetase
MARRKAPAPAVKADGWGAERIRKTFLSFFEERGHKVVPSAPLVPFGDPTLLFTTAGMVQFKPYFEGRAQPPSRRLTTVQKCFRTSDIDSVGDASHLTFFEMLGNFSVGDYFKEGAIPWAWELVTEVIGLPKDRLWTAVYLDDDEAFDLWRKVGVPAERIMRYGEEDNYWFSGDIGPCGPCSEIYYDFGPTPGCVECEKGTCHPQVDCRDEHGVGRFLELWNLVFMTYFQHEDGSRTELPGKNIDTGAGLERWAAVLQGGGRRMSVYETDLFRPIIARVEELSGRAYGQDGQTDRAMRIVAEHARAAAFLIADGVMPSNEGRGYVLRRVIRRGSLFAERLGMDSVGAQLAETVSRGMPSYPEVATQLRLVRAVLGQEERRFAEVLSSGLPVLQNQVLALRQHLAPTDNEYLRRIEQWLAAVGTTTVQEQQLRDLFAIVDDWGAKHGAQISELRYKSALFTFGIGFHEVGKRKRPQPDIHPMNLNLLDAITEATMGPFVSSVVYPGNVYSDEQKTRARLYSLVEGRSPREVVDYLRTEAVPAVRRGQTTLSGKEVFFLFDTYGLPVELTRQVAAESGFAVDEAGFEQEMEAQRERARAASRFGGGREDREKAYAALSHLQTRFVGYDTLRHESTVAAIIAGADIVEAAQEGDEVEIVLHETPFYAEGGGQVGDQGEIIGPAGRFAVEDTQWAQEGVVAHRGRVVEGRIAVNDAVVAQVDAERRRDTMRNHTATHLLQAALRQVLGTHVRQSGSLVAPDRLRFDFTHMEALKPEEVLAVQRLVNEKIREDIEVHPDEKGYEEAIAGGALAFFGEKYSDRVRVVEIAGQPGTEEHAGPPAGRYSMELCGGTHCRSTGEIGSFIIVREESIGAGLRRIEAVTGRGAEEYMQAQRDLLESLSRRVGVTPADLETKVASLLEELEAERRRAQALEREAARRAAEALLAAAERVDGAAVVAGQVPAASFEVMRETGDWLRDRLGSAVLVLGAVFGERPNFVAMITPDLTARGLHAGELVKRVAAVTGGGGGGRPEMAQAGGKDPGRLEEALGLARKLARESLSALPAKKGSPPKGG